MSRASFFAEVQSSLDQIESDGLFKRERLITGPQGAQIPVHSAKDVPDSASEVINLCANNYLGLADHCDLIAAAKKYADQFGVGMASVRFICGTQTVHRALERKIAKWLGYDDSILYAACFDANGGLFEPLLTSSDAIISDSLNHASIIDGIRLCKAQRFRYSNNDMTDLEAKLKEAREGGARHVLIATDGVFSMDGVIADLPGICDLADQYDALVMVDDCHATGFVGSCGRGTAELHGVEGRIDILTSTLGKALGGAMGGFTCANQKVIDLLRQRSRPYLFSNSLAPPLVGAALSAIELAENGGELRKRLFANADRFRAGMTQAGFQLNPGQHPIIPVMLGDAKVAQEMSTKLMEQGLYAVGFFYPVVPAGTARIRTQMSAAHSEAQIDRAVEVFSNVGRSMGVI